MTILNQQAHLGAPNPSSSIEDSDVMVSTQTEQAILSPKMIDPDLPRILRDYADPAPSDPEIARGSGEGPGQAQ